MALYQRCRLTHTRHIHTDLDHTPLHSVDYVHANIDNTDLHHSSTNPSNIHALDPLYHYPVYNFLYVRRFISYLEGRLQLLL